MNSEESSAVDQSPAPASGPLRHAFTSDAPLAVATLVITAAGILYTASAVLELGFLDWYQGLLPVLAVSMWALQTIIDDILDLSKIESGQLALDQTAFDLRKTVTDSLALLAPVAGKKGLDLAYRAERPFHPRLAGDATRTRQILVNLLNNAVKFTDRARSGSPSPPATSAILCSKLTLPSPTPASASLPRTSATSSSPSVRSIRR